MTDKGCLETLAGCLWPVIRRARVPASLLAIGGFVAIVVMRNYNFQNEGKPELTPDKILYCIWTILVPLWFFVEIVVYNSQKGKPLDGPTDDEFERVKLFQEAAKPLWAACAVVMGVLLFKSP